MEAFDPRGYKGKKPKLRYATEKTTETLKDSVSWQLERTVQGAHFAIFIGCMLLSVYGGAAGIPGLSMLMSIAMGALFLSQNIIGDPHLLGRGKNAKITGCTLSKAMPTATRSSGGLNVDVNGKRIGKAPDRKKPPKNCQIFYDTENGEALKVSSFLSNRDPQDILGFPEGTRFIYVRTIYGKPYLYF